MSLVVILSLVFLVGARQTEADILEGFDKFEEKIYSDVTIDDDFDDGSVLVMMDKNIGGINKVHDERLFGDFPREYVRDLTKVTVDIKEALIVEEEFRQVFEIKLPEDSTKENVLNVIRQLERIEGIKYAGPNYFCYPMATPDDPYYTSVDQWGWPQINMPAAWNITTGSNGIRVGIIDAGIAYHDDLNGNVAADGWSFDNSNPRDTTHHHGTNIAGIIGAVGNNSMFIAGVNWNVSLVSLKFTTGNYPKNSTNGARVSDVFDAINYAQNTNIRILNFCWGVDNDPSLLAKMHAYSGLIVLAAGNDNSYITSAYYSGDNIIIVGAVNSNDTRWVAPPDPITGKVDGSNYGPVVDIFAPGGMYKNPSHVNHGYGNVTTDSISPTGHTYPSGTSFAAPYVTGVAALIKSTDPYMRISAQVIKRIILKNVDNVPGSNGRLNAYKALDFATAQWPSLQIACATGYQTCYSEELSACYTDCGQQAWNCGGPTYPLCWQMLDSCIAGCEKQADSICMSDYLSCEMSF